LVTWGLFGEVGGRGWVSYLGRGGTFGGRKKKSKGRVSKGKKERRTNGKQKKPTTRREKITRERKRRNKRGTEDVAGGRLPVYL